MWISVFIMLSLWDSVEWGLYTHLPVGMWNLRAEIMKIYALKPKDILYLTEGCQNKMT